MYRLGAKFLMTSNNFNFFSSYYGHILFLTSTKFNIFNKHINIILF